MAAGQINCKMNLPFLWIHKNNRDIIQITMKTRYRVNDELKKRHQTEKVGQVRGGGAAINNTNHTIGRERE